MAMGYYTLVVTSFFLVLPNAVMSQVKDSSKVLQLPAFAKGKNIAASLAAPKDYISNIAEIAKNPIVLNSAEANYYNISNSQNSSFQSSYYGQLEITSSWSLAGVPFTITANNQTFSDIINDNFSNASIQFDRDIYLNQLKKKLKGKYDPSKLVKNVGENPLDLLKENAQKLLTSDLSDINKRFDGALTDKIAGIDNLKELFGGDMISLQNKLTNPEFLQSIEEKRKLLTELINKKNTNRNIDQEELQLLEKEVNNLKGVREIIAKVQEHRLKWESSGFLSSLKKADMANKQLVEQAIKDPSTIIRLAKQHFNMNSFQKFFLKVSRLNIGQNTLSNSNLSVQHLLNKGINTSFLNNNKYLMLGLGKMKSLNSILDQGFDNNLSANDGMMKMVSLGIGAQRSNNSRISFMTYDQSMNELSGLSMMRTFRTSLVTSISNQINIGSKGSLVTEISRSSTGYTSAADLDSGFQSKSAMQYMFNTNDFWRNMAFSVKYDNELPQHDLTYGIHLGKIANGYTNPGNTLLNSGSKEAGFNLRKAFFKRALNISLRSELSEYNYGEYSDRLWRSSYSVLDIRWKMKKGQFVGLRYMPNKMVRIDSSQKNVMNALSRLSIEGNLSQKLFGLYYRNNLTLSYQKNRSMLVNQMVSNTSLTISSFQNVVINDKLLYINLNYDHSDNNSAFVYLNSSFIADIGSTYMLFKKISMSSAITYNSVKSWYNQIGIKQTISNQFNERFNFNLYVDVRKNIALYQPLWYGLFRVDASIHYLIRK